MHDPAQIIPIPFFMPVPLTRSRKDGWTPARQRIFIAALHATGTVARAAKAAEMGVTSAYNLRRRPGAESFAAAWDTVERDVRDRTAAAVIEHIINGATVPRFYRGRLVGTAHRVDPRIARMAVDIAYPVDRPPPPVPGARSGKVKR